MNQISVESQNEIPKHLKKYVVQQAETYYTAEDHAVWRFILKHLSSFLSLHAHPCYMEGLKKTGITLDKIPKISEIDKRLQKFGWRAVPVSGFIPPAAFMEFQSQGFLPIASDMRTLDHILYTPAPDIVHEAAGHAPILIDPDFSHYLKQYAQVASRAIISHEDLEQYRLIRTLSDLKESPKSTASEIQIVEQNLCELNQKMEKVSEAGLLSRMNWWTAEYGLIGDIDHPKVFGAGLLSSLGESRSCLEKHVKKIPLSIDCIHYSYDITEPQPQLFVTPNFENLSLILEELSQKLSYKRGGAFGLSRAAEAKTVNTVELDSELQISGQIVEFLEENQTVFYLRFQGPTQLSLNHKELRGHNKTYHAHGYSTPLGAVSVINKSLNEASATELEQIGLKIGNTTSLTYQSGIKLKGRVKDILLHYGRLLLVSFEDCTIKHGERILFQPDWGTFDLSAGRQVTSVFGGPADKNEYGESKDEFSVRTVPYRSYSTYEVSRHKLYNQIKDINHKTTLSSFIKDHYNNSRLNWLMLIELLNKMKIFDKDNSNRKIVEKELLDLKLNENERQCVDIALSCPI